jgi:uncharacterized membrane protein YphA (DoxX/SURF4 family)
MGFMGSYRQLGTWAIVALVLLRVAVGWHFFKEGATKVRDGGFSSTGFLSASVGPMAPLFQSMIPDFDGKQRLDQANVNAEIQKYADKAASRYGFSKEQSEQLKKLVAETNKTIKQDIFDAYASEIAEYKEGFVRNERMQNDASRSGVTSLQGQKSTITTEWRSKIKPVLKDIDSALTVFASRVAGIATVEQRAAKGMTPLSLSSGGFSTAVDKIIPIFDMVVGILLVVGLLTPLAGIAGGLFLVSVVLTQFPGAAGAQPTYYQAIEAIACFVLAAADAGRYFGLDFIPWTYWQRKKAARVTTPKIASVKAA